MDDFDADSYKSKLAAVLAVEKDKVTLVVAAASVRVTAEVLVAEASVAMAALRALACDRQQDGGVCDAASTALGVTVEAAEYVTKRQHVGPPPPSSPSADNTDRLGDKQVTNGKLADEVAIAIAVGAAALLGCAIAMACLWKKSRQARESPTVALEHGHAGKALTNLGVALHNSELSRARALANVYTEPTNLGVALHNSSELSRASSLGSRHNSLERARALANVPFCAVDVLQVLPSENSLPGSPASGPVYSAQKWLANKVADDAVEVPFASGGPQSPRKGCGGQVRV